MKRLPAEWEPSEAVLIAWPHKDTDWSYMLDDVRRCYGNMIKAIADCADVIVIGPEAPDEHYYPEGTRKDRIFYVPIDTNDTWTRDYGPITIESDGGKGQHIDFRFDGWGLKFAANHDNLVTSHLCSLGVLPYERINKLGFTLEGGSIDTDGQGFVLTTSSCLLSPNRNGDLSREEIEKRIKEALGAHTLAWLDNGELEGDDTDGHIDTLARIVPPGDTIVFTACSDPEDSHYASLKAMKEEIMELRRANGMPFNLVELPLPSPINDPEDGTRLPATYANFLLLNGVAIMPVYGQPMNDLHARMALEAALPDYKIVEVDCRALIRQHGSLHCATMQIPKLKKN